MQNYLNLFVLLVVDNLWIFSCAWKPRKHEKQMSGKCKLLNSKSIRQDLCFVSFKLPQFVEVQRKWLIDELRAINNWAEKAQINVAVFNYSLRIMTVFLKMLWQSFSDFLMIKKGNCLKSKDNLLPKRMKIIRRRHNDSKCFS